MQEDLLVFVKDRLVPRSEATVSVFDAAFQSGDQVWEGLRVYSGIVYEMDRHLDRLERSAERLSIVLPMSRDKIRQALNDTLRANGFDDGVHVRLMLSRGEKLTSGMDPRQACGPAVLVIAAEYKPIDEEPAATTLRTTSIRRPPRNVLDMAIHHGNQLNSILARLDVQDSDADAALMLDIDGNVAEADTANIFVVHGSTIRTPRPVACLPGITRGIVMELAREAGYSTFEVDLAPAELETADEVFLTGTICELAPVTTIDGKAIGPGTPGPVWRELLDLYRHTTVSGDTSASADRSLPTQSDDSQES